MHANDIVNERPWPGRDSPNEALSRTPAVKPRTQHVFGEYCVYKISTEQKGGKWQPNGEMGIWLGHSKSVSLIRLDETWSI